jgi:large subunit ribosomal protein L25
MRLRVPAQGGNQTRFGYHPLPLMASTDSSTLQLSARGPEGSRSARRLRREGLVPGVMYGGGDEPQHFAVDARLLRNTLAHAAQVIEVSVDGAANANVLIKDVQRHPVRGEAVHVDLLRVRMDVAIHATVPIEFLGADDAPGVSEGGIFNQELREVNIEALPGDIPDSIQHDVSGLAINETITLAVLSPPAGVTLLDDPEVVIATITPPTLEPVDDEIETETGLVGEDGEPVDAEAAEAQAQGDTAEEAEQKADSDAS